MNAFQKYLSDERLHRINQAWKYITFPQRAWIYVRAVWWSLPGVIEIVEYIQLRFDVWLTHFLYRAHWI